MARLTPSSRPVAVTETPAQREADAGLELLHRLWALRLQVDLGLGSWLGEHVGTLSAGPVLGRELAHLEDTLTRLSRLSA